MIDQTILELINKEIDHVITSREKQKLHQLLEANPEALKYYNEIIKSEKLLDEIPEVEPSINLKKKILNSIDYNLYNKKNQPSFSHHLSTLFSGLRKKPVLSFSLGLLIGLIVSVAISYYVIYNPGNVDNIYGAMGISEAKFIKSVDLNNDDFKGNVGISQSNNLYNLNFNINSADNYDIRLEYNSSQMTPSNFYCADLSNVKFEKGKDFIQISTSKPSQFALSLLREKPNTEKILVKVISNGNEILNKEITVSN